MAAKRASRGQFTFYRSFFESILKLPKSRQLQVFDAVCRYGLDGEEPGELASSADAVFLLIRPVLDAARSKAVQRKKDMSSCEDILPLSAASGKKGEREREKENDREDDREKDREKDNDMEADREKEADRENETDFEGKHNDEGAVPAVLGPAAPDSAASGGGSFLLPASEESMGFDSQKLLCLEPEPGLTEEKLRRELSMGAEPFDLLSRADPELGCDLNDWLYARCKRGTPPSAQRRRVLAEQLLSMPPRQRRRAVRQAARTGSGDFLPPPGNN